MEETRKSAIFNRRLQFGALMLLTVALTLALCSFFSPSATILGMPARAVAAIAGMLLVFAVAFIGYRILFSNLPQDDGKYNADAISKVEDIASTRPLGKLAKIKYSQRKPKGKGVPYEGLFSGKDQD